jgi:transcriptional regulator with XRE-family HTH domain
MSRKKQIIFHKNSEWLLNTLKDSGLSKKKFAEKLNISRNTLDNWIKRDGVTYEDFVKITQIVPNLKDTINNEETTDYADVESERIKTAEEIRTLARKLNYVVMYYDSLIEDEKTKVGGRTIKERFAFPDSTDPENVNMKAARQVWKQK